MATTTREVQELICDRCEAEMGASPKIIQASTLLHPDPEVQMARALFYAATGKDCADLCRSCVRSIVRCGPRIAKPKRRASKVAK